MDPLAAIRAKQAAGAVLTPLEWAQLNGAGQNIQGMSAPRTGSVSVAPAAPSPGVAVSSAPYQGNVTVAGPPAPAPSMGASRAYIPAFTESASTTGGVSTGSGFHSFKTLPDGTVVDLSTPEGARAYFESNKQLLSSQYGKSLDTLHNTLANNTAAARITNAASLRTLNANYGNIDQAAQAYGRGYATNAVNLDNSYGTNLAQIQQAYSNAAPSGFQSAQAYDTDYAKNNYTQGMTALTADRNATVGSGYVAGTNPDGSLRFGTLGADSTYGKAYGANAASIDDLNKQYDIYGTGQTQAEQDAESQLKSQYDTGLTSTADNINLISSYNNANPFTFNASAYKDPGVQPLDISKYTASPVTSSSLSADPSSQPLYAPNAPVQTQKSQYLGYAPGSTQSNYLNKFLTATAY